jgi:hypothetical protein
LGSTADWFLMTTIPVKGAHGTAASNDIKQSESCSRHIRRSQAEDDCGSFGVTTPPPLVPVNFSNGTSDATVAARLSRASAQLLQRALRPAGDGVAGGVVVAAVQRKKHPPNPAETHAVACAILAMLSRGDSSLAASASVHRWRRSRRGG